MDPLQKLLDNVEYQIAKLEKEVVENEASLEFYITLNQ